jgi:hypothetical protein
LVLIFSTLFYEAILHIALCWSTENFSLYNRNIPLYIHCTNHSTQQMA